MPIDMQQLINSDVEVNTKVMTTIRDLKDGDYYMPIRLLRRYGTRRMSWSVRRRTEDPFNSETVLGTKIKTYPSDRVHPVTLIVKPHTN